MLRASQGIIHENFRRWKREQVGDIMRACRRHGRLCASNATESGKEEVGKTLAPPPQEHCTSLQKSIRLPGLPKQEADSQ